MSATTTIQVTQKLRRKLAHRKEHERETYEDVIERALDAAEHRGPGLTHPTWQAIAEVKDSLRAAYGARFERLILFGSTARGEATVDSDIDLMLVLHGDVDVSKEIRKIVDQTYDIDLRRGTLTSVVPIALGDFLTRGSPLLMNVRREGVVV